MRPPLPALAAALLLALAGPGLAAGPSRTALVKDHRDLKLFKRELVEDRRILDRLRARMERLTSIYSSRVLDTRAVWELHAKVQEELWRDARVRRLQVLPTIQAAAQARAAEAPGGAPEPLSPGWGPQDDRRVEQIPEEWAALRDKLARADVEARYKLLAERVALARFKLSHDLSAFRSLGGDPADLFKEADEEAEAELVGLPR